MAQKHSNTTNNQSSSYTIECRAIDTSVCLGSLYNAYHDHVLEEKYLIDAKSSSKKLNKTQYVLKDELIKINEELRLSTLFDLAPTTGVAAFVDYPHLVNKYTRILCYTFTHRIERFSEKVEKTEENNRLSLPKANVTHIITGITAPDVGEDGVG